MRTKTENQENQPKPKKTNTQKRIIAAQIAMYCFTGALVATLPGIIESNAYDKDIRLLDNEQTAIYEQFMASEEFSDSFKEEFTKLSNDYANGLIDYDEFDKKVKHLNSVEYAQEVLESSNNTEFKEQVEEIEQKKEERREEYNSSIAPNVSLGAMSIGVSASIGSMIATMVYGIKEDKERKRKYASNKIKHQEYETGPVLIDKKTTYYAYDHKETKTANIIKKENNPSCNENCLGVRYYDSTSGTIRDTADHSYEEKIPNVPRHVDACIIKTEKEEKENIL